MIEKVIRLPVLALFFFTFSRLTNVIFLCWSVEETYSSWKNVQ